MSFATIAIAVAAVEVLVQKPVSVAADTALFFGVELIAAASATVAAVVTVTTTAAAAVVEFLCGKWSYTVWILLTLTYPFKSYFSTFFPTDGLLPGPLLHLLRVSRPLSADGRGGQGAHGAQTGGSHGEKCFFT